MFPRKCLSSPILNDKKNMCSSITEIGRGFKAEIIVFNNFWSLFLTKELGDSWILFFPYCKFTQILNTTKLKKENPHYTQGTIDH
jgi:hypothetical protein